MRIILGLTQFWRQAVFIARRLTARDNVPTALISQ